ncbi:dyslexia-associated protein KIAA0319 homolog isoform X2 [Ascaphus truei]|uniref:dyslexia-associated protein KIAA0319 homolog isoform X2 n=1 Tax=Ascaphus truei TaxID=8439 RepID=UPI003F59A300
MSLSLCAFSIWLCTITGYLCEQCREGATYADAAIPPNLQKTHIMRVPNARTMSDCTTACCNQSGCDLSWMLGSRCYIVNCQRKENCEPEKREHMKSYLTFVLRPSPRFIPLPLYGNVMANRRYLGEQEVSDEEMKRLKDLSLLNKDSSLQELAEYTDDYNGPQLDFLRLSPKADHKGNSDLDYMSWLLSGTENSLNSSAVEVGRHNEDAVESPREEPTMSNMVLNNTSEVSARSPLNPTVAERGRSMHQPVESNKSFPMESLTILPNSSVDKQDLPVATEKTESNSTIQFIPEHHTVPGHPTNAVTYWPSSAYKVLPTTTAEMALKHLTVSAGGNMQVILPKNEVELNVFVVPEAPADMPYSFEWNLISQPVDYLGEIERKHTRTSKLSKLSTGLYELKVAVSSDNAFGEGFVNVTVTPARVNQPPVAVVSPREQEVTLPATFSFIDGSQSADDDNIFSYHWEEIKGPVREQKASGDSPVLHLSDLVIGKYTFRLTVTDSDGASNSTTAYVTVNKPVDYPPIANAGPNQAITLHQNYITLNGNKSSDDHQIVSYEWSLSPTSKGKVVAMQGVRSPYLQVSAMQVGDYTFQLTVTDSSKQQSTTQVTVIVLPENNSPPMAETGPDKELTFPVEATTLDGSKSRDDKGIVSYGWECISGPSRVTIRDSDKAVGLVTGLQVGTYRFSLTVKDHEGLSGTATLSVTVKEENNSPPKSRAGGTHVIVLPNNSIYLDGSNSTDDQRVVSYLWTRDGQSPAAGDVMFSSDHDPVLQLTNLVEGIYIFHLKVTDAKGDSDVDTATVEVRADRRRQNLVELILQVGVGQLTEQQKDTLVRQLAVLLNVLDSGIKVQKIQAHSDLSTVILFYVQNGYPLKIRKAADVTRTLQDQLLKEKADFLLYKVLRVDTAVCLLKCSGHGHCDPITKSCLCYPFWMENLIQRYFREGESNCEWSVLYVMVLTFATVAVMMGLTWFCICCCKSRKRTKIRKKTKYTILDNIDEQERMELRPKYGIKHRSTEHNSSLMVSESEFDSDQDTIFSREKVDRENPKNMANGALKNGAPFNFSSKCR